MAVSSACLVTICAIVRPAAYPPVTLNERAALGRSVSCGMAFRYQPPAASCWNDANAYAPSVARESVVTSALAYQEAGFWARGPPRVSRSSTTGGLYESDQSPVQQF